MDNEQMNECESWEITNQKGEKNEVTFSETVMGLLHNYIFAISIFLFCHKLFESKETSCMFLTQNPFSVGCALDAQ